MNREDVIRLAREAGFEIEQPSDGHNVSGDNDCLERFAALVADIAATEERKAICRLVQDMWRGIDADRMVDAIHERGQE
jgi:hypothetical protein